MTNLAVTPNELIEAYEELITKIHDSLMDHHKKFILSLANGEPDWHLIKFL